MLFFERMPQPQYHSFFYYISSATTTNNKNNNNENITKIIIDLHMTSIISSSNTSIF